MFTILLFYYAFLYFFFFNDTATTEIYTGWYTLSLHDALPISFFQLRRASYSAHGVDFRQGLRREASRGRWRTRAISSEGDAARRFGGTARWCGRCRWEEC